MSETSGHEATDDLNGPVHARVHDILESIKLQKGQTDSQLLGLWQCETNEAQIYIFFCSYFGSFTWYFVSLGLLYTSCPLAFFSRNRVPPFSSLRGKIRFRKRHNVNFGPEEHQLPHPQSTRTIKHLDNLWERSLLASVKLPGECWLTGSVILVQQ